MRSHEILGGPRNAQEVLGGPWKSQELGIDYLLWGYKDIIRILQGVARILLRSFKDFSGISFGFC